MIKNSHQRNLNRPPNRRPSSEDAQVFQQALEEIAIKTRCGLTPFSWILGYSRLYSLESANIKRVKYVCLAIMVCLIGYNAYMGIVMHELECTKFAFFLFILILINRLLAKIWLVPWNTSHTLKTSFAFVALALLAILEATGPLLTPEVKRELVHLIHVTTYGRGDWQELNLTVLWMIAYEFALPLLYGALELFDAVMESKWRSQIGIANHMRFGSESLTIDILFNRVYNHALQKAVIWAVVCVGAIAIWMVSRQ
jgi:hypothetical protein